MRRHQLQHERETEENSATPPADLGQEVSGLADTNERVGGGAGAAKARSKAATLPALEKNGQHDDDTVDDE
jgi:hypothetical protein